MYHSLAGEIVLFIRPRAETYYYKWKDAPIEYVTLFQEGILKTLSIPTCLRYNWLQVSVFTLE